MTRVAALLAGTWLFCSGCSRMVPPDALVLSQTPNTNTTAPTEAADELELRYPAGSRVVLSAPPFNREICVLSAGFPLREHRRYPMMARASYLPGRLDRNPNGRYMKLGSAPAKRARSPRNPAAQSSLRSFPMAASSLFRLSRSRAGLGLRRLFTSRPPGADPSN